MCVCAVRGEHVMIGKTLVAIVQSPFSRTNKNELPINIFLEQSRQQIQRDTCMPQRADLQKNEERSDHTSEGAGPRRHELGHLTTFSESTDKKLRSLNH